MSERTPFTHLLRAVDQQMADPSRTMPVPTSPPPVQLRQADTNTQDVAANRERSSHPLPAPTAYTTKQWKIAWFLRAMRVEEMDALCEQLAKYERPIHTANDVKDWLLTWAKEEHNGEETPVAN